MAMSKSFFALVLCFSLIELCLAWRDPSHLHHHLQTRAPELKEREQQCESKSCYKFYNDNTAPYLIEEWPLVPKYIATGEFYSGSIPIDESDPSRTLFFIFKPAINASINPKEVTIWLNGGPGCSSLVGFFQENGPILWRPGTNRPERNPWSWAQVTNMLWVEQPVGTGFTQGNITARNEVDISKDFVGFYKNWQKVFGISNYKTYVTGESYAGRYVPYIAAEMLNQKDETYFDVGGALIYDGVIGSYIVAEQNIPVYDFVKANNLILNLNQTFLDQLKKVNDQCGYTQWMQKYLQFPPPGNQPQTSKFQPNASCSTQSLAYEAIYTVNPCFNVYHITDTCPVVEDRLAYQRPYTLQPYFNRTDVRKALHAPPPKDLYDWWFECNPFENVFKGPSRGEGPEGNNDRSQDPIQGVLPQIIEATNRVLISNGDWDGLILTNGSLLSIQNMTWNGQLGFQEAPSQDFVVPIAYPKHYDYWPQGIMGKQHYERGLMWVQSYQTGHMQPEYQPRASLRHIMWVLGRIDEL